MVHLLSLTASANAMPPNMTIPNELLRSLRQCVIRGDTGIINALLVSTSASMIQPLIFSAGSGDSQATESDEVGMIFASANELSLPFSRLLVAAKLPHDNGEGFTDRLRMDHVSEALVSAIRENNPLWSELISILPAAVAKRLFDWSSETILQSISDWTATGQSYMFERATILRMLNVLNCCRSAVPFHMTAHLAAVVDQFQELCKHLDSSEAHSGPVDMAIWWFW